jgi:hypothetical protein
MRKLVTRESMIALLDNEAIRNQVIGRALVVILKQQTEAGGKSNTTREYNLRGFACSVCNTV